MEGQQEPFLNARRFARLTLLFYVVVGMVVLFLVASNIYVALVRYPGRTIVVSVATLMIFWLWHKRH